MITSNYYFLHVAKIHRPQIGTIQLNLLSLRKQIGYRQVSLLKSAARQSECISNLELDINKITQKITFSLKKKSKQTNNNKKKPLLSKC